MTGYFVIHIGKRSGKSRLRAHDIPLGSLRITGKSDIKTNVFVFYGLAVLMNFPVPGPSDLHRFRAPGRSGVIWNMWTCQLMNR